METKQPGVRLEQAPISIIGDIWETEVSFLILFFSLKPMDMYTQFIGWFGIRRGSGSPDKAAKKGSMQKKCKLPSLSNIISSGWPNLLWPNLFKQVEQQHGRCFLKNIRFYLFFPPINKCRHIYLSSQSPDTWSIFPGSNTFYPLSTGTKAGPECIYFILSCCTWSLPHPVPPSCFSSTFDFLLSAFRSA